MPSVIIPRTALLTLCLNTSLALAQTHPAPSPSPTQTSPTQPQSLIQAPPYPVPSQLSAKTTTPQPPAETCTPQSQLLPADRDSLTLAALAFAQSVQSNNPSALSAALLPALARTPGVLANMVSSTAPHLKDASLTIEQLYLLDATQNKTPTDASFFCSLNHSPTSTDFQIPGLSPGLYAFAIVHADTPKSPWRLSFLLRRNLYQSPGQPSPLWSIAGFYPKPLTAATHDGVWYWTQARTFAAQKQTWNAWLFYREAETLLQPAPILSSTNLDKLHRELSAATPPALSEGISPSVPLVVKSTDATEYRFTTLIADDSLTPDKLDLILHLEVDPPPTPPDPLPKTPKTKTKPPTPIDPTTRNHNAIAALLAAYPELRTPFHSIWIFADTPNQNPVVTQQILAALP